MGKVLSSLFLIFATFFVLTAPALAQGVPFDTIIRPPKGTYKEDPKNAASGQLVGLPDKTNFAGHGNLRGTQGAKNMLQHWKESFKTTAYILSGLGVFALAIMAFFGKFQWKWLLMLTFGLFFIGTFEFLSGTTGHVGDGWLHADNMSDWTGANGGDKTTAGDPKRLWNEVIWRAGYLSERFEVFTYTVSGVGVLAMAMGAFIGRFSWKWFFMVSGMLLMVSGFQYWISYLHDAQLAKNSFDLANERIQDFYGHAETFTYIVSGLGMLAMVILAFMGKFQWKWFTALCGALIIIAGFQYMVAFLS